MQILHLPDTAATERLGVALAKQLRTQRSFPVLVLLGGDLGAGKTSLARAMIRALMQDAAAEVPSPTFTLLQTYESATEYGGGPIYHYDLYRLKAAEEIFELDWEAALAEGITIVEWPERLGSLRPNDAKTIMLELDGDGDSRGRRASLTGFDHV